MKTTKRFENAVSRLYEAFHAGTLESQSCRACAVGNIVGTQQWISGVDFDNPTEDGFYARGLITIQSGLSHAYKAFSKSGYSVEELSEVEYIFMREHDASGITMTFEDALYDIEKYGYWVANGVDFDSEDEVRQYFREVQFKSLCKVVEYLSELDGIENPMDYSKLFETENCGESVCKAKYQLEEVFND